MEKKLTKVTTEFYDPEQMNPEILVAFGTDTHATMVMNIKAITR